MAEEKILHESLLPATWEVLPELLDIRNAKHFYLVLICMRQYTIYATTKETAARYERVYGKAKSSGTDGSEYWAMPSVKASYGRHNEEKKKEIEGTEGTEEMRVIERMPLICLVTANELLLGLDYVRKKVLKETGIDMKTVHQSINPVELKILIKTPREYITKRKFLDTLCTQTDPLNLWLDLSSYTLGLTSMVEMENGEIKHLTLLDGSIETNPIIWEAYNVPQRFSHAYVEFMSAKIMQFKKLLGNLALKTGAIINSGNSFHFVGRELLTPKEWLCLMKKIERVAGIDPLWSEIQRDFVYKLNLYNLLKYPILLKAHAFCLLRIEKSSSGERNAPRVWEIMGTWEKENPRQQDLLEPRQLYLNLYTK